MKTVMTLLFFTCGFVHEAFTDSEKEILDTDHRHVLLCANNIIKRYFTPGRYLLLSLPCNVPGHSSQLLDIMLNNIHNEMRWQIRVLRPDPILKATPDNDNIPHIYVIFLGPHSNDSDILLDLSHQLVFINSTAFLNRRAQFLIFASEQLTAPKLLTVSIFRKLRESYGIVNLVVIVSRYKPDMPNLRQILPDIDINNVYVYRWLPIMLHDCHGNVRDHIYLDKRLVEEQRHLIDRGNLFPEKILIDLQDVPIKLSGYFPDGRIQSHLHSRRENERNENFSRIEIDFIKLILQPLNLKISYDFQTANNRSDVNLYDELLKKVILGESDIAVGSLPLDIRLNEIGEPTIPYFQTPISWYVPCAKPLGRTGMIFRVLTFPVWLCFAIVFLTVTVTTWLLAIHAKVTESTRYMNIASCFYILWSVALGVSVPKIPQTPRLRLLFMQWVVHCLAITTVFQALFTSFLVQPDMENQITSVEELLSSGLEYGYTSTFEKYIEAIQDSSYREIKQHRSTCTTYTSCVERVITSDFATLSTSYLVDYILTTRMSGGLRYPICPLSHNLATFRASMYLSKGSPLLNPINQIIRRLTESGLEDRYFRDHRNVSIKDAWSLIDIKKRYSHYVDNYFVFSLSHLHLAFVSLLTGVGVSFIVFLCEVSYPKLQKRCIFTDKNLIS